MISYLTTKKQQKGVSPVIGFILLIAIGSMMAAVLGGAAITALDYTADQTYNEQTSLAFQDLNSAVVQTSLGQPGTEKQVDLSRIPTSNNITGSESSSIEIYSIDGPNRTLVTESQVGYLKYKQGDTTYYYENGGVWTYQNGNISEVQNKPLFQYQDETITFPILSLSLEDSIFSNSVTLRNEESTRATDSIAVENEEVEIVVKSENYQGWAKYFEDEYGFDVSVNPEEQKTTAKIGVQAYEIGTITDASLTTGDLIVDKGEINGDVSVGGTVSGEKNINGDVNRDDIELASFDPIIESKIQTGKEEGVDPAGSTYFSDEKVYYIDGNYSPGSVDITADDHDVLVVIDGDTDLNGTWNVNVSNGYDAEVVVDGDLTVRNESVNVNTTAGEDGGRLTTYVTGDVLISNGNDPGFYVPNGDYKQNVMIGSTESSVIFGQHATFEGIMYMPADSSGSTGSTSNGNGNGGGPGAGTCNGSSSTVCMGSGQPQLTGALMAGSTELANPNTEINYDESVDGFKLGYEEETGGDVLRISYFHTSENRTSVSDD
jgi:hypothetical protein